MTKIAFKAERKIRTPRKTAATKALAADTAVVESTETDAEIVERLRERFEILDTMTQMTIDGVVKGMVVTGPPGVGKSYGVETVLDQNSIFDKLAGNRLKFGVEKGAASAIGLYKLLYNYADRGNVLVLDDCDSVLHDETSLNLLKAALDSGKKRRISWNTDSALLRREGIPDSFEFKGAVIFITNLRFDKARGKIKDHLDAIMSRCHYLDLTMDTPREKILRCRQIVADGMLAEYDFTKAQEAEIVDFIFNNQHRMREVSLRMVTKIADLRRSMSDKWERMAEVTCMLRR
jgi:hypothetical protein